LIDQSLALEEFVAPSWSLDERVCGLYYHFLALFASTGERVNARKRKKFVKKLNIFCVEE